MQQPGAGTAADRRHGLAGAVLRIGHQAVGVSRIDKPSLDQSTIKLAARHKLMQHERAAIERLIARTGRNVGQTLDLAVESSGAICAGWPCVR
jgi:hypothetical protein